MKIQGLVTKVQIKADAQGNAPTTIELLRVGDWHTLWHGDFEITLADLHEYAANFAKGVGLVEGDKRAPIDYAHETWDKAAGWITGLSVDEARQALVASVEWTPEGAKGIQDKEWAYISPEFNPRGSLPYADPEGPEGEDGIPEFIANVLTGAALTNIPLFKKLKPIMASRVPSKKRKADVTSGDGKESNPKGESMKLEDILAKQVSERTEEEKAFLSDHKAELSDEQQAQLDAEASDAEAKAQTDKEAADKAAAEQAEKGAAAAEAETASDATKVEASAVTGAISPEELRQLRADAQAGRAASEELRRTKADGVVAASVKAGQVKSGDKERWVKVLLASNDNDRKEIESLLAGLPRNESLGKEIGDAGQNVSVAASAEVHDKVLQIQADARAKGTTIAYSAARKQVLDSNPTLKSQLEEEDQ